MTMKKTIIAGIGFCLLCLSFLTPVHAEGEAGPQGGVDKQEIGMLARKIKPGDTIKISVWKYSDMDASLMVGNDGTINYSYIGEIPVAGRTPEEVRLFITKKLDQDYIANPQVDVKIDTKALTIFVVGEVVKPGSYLFEPRLDPLKAIALAGGMTDFASNHAVIIRKNDAGEETQIKVNIKKLMKATPDRGQYELEPGDMVVVKRGWI
jgi:polysaccharide export outer membrane protein